MLHDGSELTEFPRRQRNHDERVIAQIALPSLLDTYHILSVLHNSVQGASSSQATYFVASTQLFTKPCCQPFVRIYRPAAQISLLSPQIDAPGADRSTLAMNGAAVPTVNVEHASASHIKAELGDGAPSPYMDEDDLYEEDAGDLDFSQAQQQLWLSHIPRSLWETWSSLGDDEEIEIGTIRVEGTNTEPRRVRRLSISCALSDR